MSRKSSLIWVIVYLFFGLYFINSGLAFYPLPESLSLLDKWITVIGGALILLGGINQLRVSRRAS